jgi:hypothetical protein
VGGYLLGLWGLPVSIIEPVVFHHNPAECRSREFTPLTAVHVANVLQYEGDPNLPFRAKPTLDAAYLDEVGVRNRVPAWRDAASAKQPA